MVARIDEEAELFKARLQSAEARAAFEAFLMRKTGLMRCHVAQGKTLFITGASRGIGLAIALKAAADGANVAIAAKTVEPHPKLEGTIHTAAAEIEQSRRRRAAAPRRRARRGCRQGGDRQPRQNSAASTSWSTTPARSRSRRSPQTDMKRFDLMNGINARGTFLVSKYALPYLAKAANPHILMMSPPLDMKEKWFAPHTAYSMAKFGMSLVVLGLAGELRGKIAVNALWPRTTIATAAIKNLLGGDAIMRMSRTPDIMADAAYRIFHKPKSFTGNFLIDDTFLAGEGVTDFDQYRVDPSQPLQVGFLRARQHPAAARREPGRRRPSGAALRKAARKHHNTG